MAVNARDFNMTRVQLDPSLIGGGNAINAFQSAYNNGLKMQASQQEIDDNQFKMDTIRNEQGQQNAFAKLIATQGFDATTPQGKAQMYGVGGLKNTQAYLKSAADIGNVTAETANKAANTRKADLESHLQKFEIIERLMRPVRDQAGYDAMRQQLQQIPALADMAQQVPSEYNPQVVADNMAKAMTLKDRLAAEHQQLTLAETGRHNLAGEGIQIRGQDRQSFDNAEGRKITIRGQDRQSSDSAASRAVTMRGQNMTDARSRESTASTMSKPFEVTGEDGKPVLVRQDRAGNISRVEGFSPKSGAEKPMTDAQSKAALFGSRMESSDKIIQDLAKSGTQKSVPFSNAGLGVGSAVTALSSSSQQQLQQAKRDFINATLRRESGAVISPSEFDNAERQYFPQIGDSEAVIKQKSGNRAIATRGVQAEIPKGQRNVVKDIIGGDAGSFDADKEARYQKWKAGQGK